MCPTLCGTAQLLYTLVQVPHFVLVCSSYENYVVQRLQNRSFFFFILDCEDRKDGYQNQDVVNQNKDILFFIVGVGRKMLQKKNS